VGVDIIARNTGMTTMKLVGNMIVISPAHDCGGPLGLEEIPMRGVLVGFVKNGELNFQMETNVEKPITGNYQHPPDAPTHVIGKKL
jgi:hypothetical protein